MDSTSPELASALLQWINSFDIPPPITAWVDLADGLRLWDILRGIEPRYFVKPLPEVDRKSSDNWIPRWQNWKHIEREVTVFIREECEKLPQLSRRLNVDLKSIAQNGSPQDIIKIVKCVLLAAFYSAHSNEKMVLLMQELGPKIAAPIAMWITEMEDINQSMVDEETEPNSELDLSPDSEPAETPSKPSPYVRDPELEREEKLLRVLQEKKKVESRLEDVSQSLKEEQERADKLQDELEEAKYNLDRRRGRGEDNDFAQLSQRADQDREFIAELEGELASARTKTEQQERQLNQLRGDQESKQDLRDQLQLITAEREELQQKVKANENLKKKIQSLQEQETNTRNLRRDLQAAQEQLADFEKLQQRCSALEKANEENAQTIANGEQEIFDQKQARKRLDHELKVFQQKYEQSRDILTNAQETIRDLEDKLHMNPDQTSSGVDNLDDELNAEAGAPQHKPEEKRSQPVTITAEAIVLQQNLDISKKANNRLEQRCLDLLQENLGFKALIEDVNDAQANDLHPFQRQARRLEELSKELDLARSQYISASNQVAELKQRLESADGTAASMDAIGLKENRERQKYIAELEADVNEQRGLLRHALLSSEALQKEDSRLRSANEFKLIRQRLEIINATPVAEAEAIIKSAATNITDRIESARGALLEKEKLLADQTLEFARLQSELEAIKSRPPVPPKDQRSDKALHAELLQQQKENKLLSSAWYDITCRLQSNTVLLARRREDGNSWLVRMRSTTNTGTSAQNRPSGKSSRGW